MITKFRLTIAAFFSLVFFSLFWGAGYRNDALTSSEKKDAATVSSADGNAPPIKIKSPEIRKLLENARRQMEITKSYNPEYVVISYPMGDVAPEKGVCTDVVIRAFRAAGIDLQKEVHEDMKGNFAVYPTKWGLPAPDANIDHRRVPNLQTFFARKGKKLPLSDKADDYRPGDVVSWDLNGRGLTHIGVVSDKWNSSTKRFSIIHNIGAGTREEDVVFDWKITGHYRYF